MRLITVRMITIGNMPAEQVAVLKSLTPVGEWLPSVKANFHAGVREAQRFMQLFANWD